MSDIVLQCPKVSHSLTVCYSVLQYLTVSQMINNFSECLIMSHRVSYRHTVSHSVSLCLIVLHSVSQYIRVSLSLWHSSIESHSFYSVSQCLTCRTWCQRVSKSLKVSNSDLQRLKVYHSVSHVVRLSNRVSQSVKVSQSDFQSLTVSNSVSRYLTVP